MKYSAKLDASKTVANVQINGGLSAQDMDALIRRLALLRADMSPSVPMTRSEVEQADTAVLIEDKPGLVIAARQGGGFRVWLRHRGLGWNGYQIDDQTASGMANFINHRVEADAVNLIRDQVGHTH